MNLKKQTRRDFIKTNAIAALSVVILPTIIPACSRGKMGM